jgi:hypothetical protein
MGTEGRGPIPDSYWVDEGRLVAGEYPGARDDDQARAKLRRILDAGVTSFLDLTEEGEYNLKPYAPFLGEETLARGRQVLHRRMPIRDRGTPTVEGMRRILDTIDGALQGGHVVYVHCWGGIGRTGTVVGCYLVRHGMSGPEALDEIARRRRGTPDGYRRSPENDEQEQMILTWPPGG